MNLVRARRQGEWAALEGFDLLLRGSDAGAAAAEDGTLWLGVRPENVVLTEAGAPCVVEQTLAMGANNLLSLRTGAGYLKAWVPAGVRFREGETVRVSFLP